MSFLQSAISCQEVWQEPRHIPCKYMRLLPYACLWKLTDFIAKMISQMNVIVFLLFCNFIYIQKLVFNSFHNSVWDFPDNQFLASSSQVEFLATDRWSTRVTWLLSEGYIFSVGPVYRHNCVRHSTLFQILAFANSR